MSQWMALTGMALAYIVLLAASAWRARLIGNTRHIAQKSRSRARSVPAEAYLQSRRVRHSVAEDELRIRATRLHSKEQCSAGAAAQVAIANHQTSGLAQRRASGSTLTHRSATSIQATE